MCYELCILFKIYVFNPIHIFELQEKKSLFRYAVDFLRKIFYIQKLKKKLLHSMVYILYNMVRISSRDKFFFNLFVLLRKTFIKILTRLITSFFTIFVPA